MSTSRDVSTTDTKLRLTLCPSCIVIVQIYKWVISSARVWLAIKNTPNVKTRKALIRVIYQSNIVV